MDAEKIIGEYETILLKSDIVTSSFQCILDKNLNWKQRRIQLICFTIYFVYIFPRHTIFSLLYVAEEDVRNYYQYWLGDYLSQLGMYGRSLVLVYLVYVVGITSDKILLRRFESSGSMAFLTDMLALKKRPASANETANDTETIETSDSTDLFDEKEKTRLLSAMKLYQKLVSHGIQMTISNMCIFDGLALLWFIYEVSPVPIVCAAAIGHYIVHVISTRIVIRHVLGMYLLLIVTTDYFNARINTLLKIVEELKTDFTQDKLSRALYLTDLLMLDFKKHNHSLRYLVRNLESFYCVELSVMFFIFTLEMHIWHRIPTVTTIVIMSVSILITALYIGQLHTRIINLYYQLNTVAARSTVNVRRRLIPMKTRLRLRSVIKELGSEETEGQFVVGLTDVSGAATSSLEIFQMTLSTISYTLMMIDMTKYSNNI